MHFWCTFDSLLMSLCNSSNKNVKKMLKLLRTNDENAIFSNKKNQLLKEKLSRKRVHQRNVVWCNATKTVTTQRTALTEGSSKQCFHAKQTTKQLLSSKSSMTMLIKAIRFPNKIKTQVNYSRNNSQGRNIKEIRFLVRHIQQEFKKQISRKEVQSICCFR